MGKCSHYTPAEDHSQWAYDHRTYGCPDERRENLYEIARALYESFRHFYHLDRSNAAMHMAPVRYSPITFRLAEVLTDNSRGVYIVVVNEGWSEHELDVVMHDRGLYPEDRGRE